MRFLVIKEALALVRLFGVLLFHFSGHWISESDNEMNFGSHSTLVWTKHDGVWSLVIELGLQSKRIQINHMSQNK